MGCCESSNQKLSSVNYSKKIKELLDLGSISSLSIALKYYEKKIPQLNSPIIDQEIVTINNVPLNSLGYCLFLGKLELFRFLLNYGASLKAMDKLLEKSNLKAINVICYKGYREMLEFYLPIYLASYKANSTQFKSFTIDLKDSVITRMDFDLAIHSAVRAGMVQIVSYLFSYFKDWENCPVEFNIHVSDDTYGEDTGLIACRSGCFALVKFLHETCKMDFKQLNSNKENAYMVCVAGYNNNPNYTYLECLEYLIEEVKLDITYMHEELLLVADGHDVVRIIEKELHNKGIRKKKKDLSMCMVGRNLAENSLDNEPGIVFTKEDLDYLRGKDWSIMSSIQANGNFGKTTFLSENLE